MLIQVLRSLWQLCITSEKSEVSIPKVKETGIFDPAMWELSLDVNRDAGFEEPDTKLWRNQLKRITNLPLGLSAHLHSPNKLLEALLYSLTDRRHQCHSRDDIIFVTALSIAQMSKPAPNRGWEVAPCSQAALLGPPPTGADPLVHLIALPRGFWISSLLWRQGHRVRSQHLFSHLNKKAMKKNVTWIWNEIFFFAELAFSTLFSARQFTLLPAQRSGGWTPDQADQTGIPCLLVQLLARPWWQTLLEAGLWD